MSVLKVLAIGDPHFKSDNEIETEMMTKQLCDIIIRENPHFVVILGDILHRHEKVDLYPFRRATAFLRAVRSVSKHMYVIVGNHDRPNNNIFLTDEHSFNSLKEWDRTTVIDDVQVHNAYGSDGIPYQFVFAPYVPNGRLAEAFATKSLDFSLPGISGVFTHQEYMGSKINQLTKSETDTWPAVSPVNFSGHIHDYEEVQSNLIYTGTPIQHGPHDTLDKTVSMIEYSPTDVPGTAHMSSHKRISLVIPRKFVVNLTPEELSVYVMPPNCSIKIKVEGPASVIKTVMALDNVKRLAATLGVKIVVIDTTPSRAGDFTVSTTALKARTSFQERIFGAVTSEDTGVRDAFRHLFA